MDNAEFLRLEMKKCTVKKHSHIFSLDKKVQNPAVLIVSLDKRVQNPAVLVALSKVTVSDSFGFQSCLKRDFSTRSGVTDSM